MQARSLPALVAILSIACSLGSLTSAQQPTDSDSDASLSALLTQRRDTLEKRVEVLEYMLAQGKVEATAVFAARDQLLDAELQLAETKEQRLALHRTRIDNMRELEELIKRRHKAGQSPLEAALSTTAARLQAEIDLLREQV